MRYRTPRPSAVRNRPTLRVVCERLIARSITPKNAATFFSEASDSAFRTLPPSSLVECAILMRDANIDVPSLIRHAVASMKQDPESWTAQNVAEPSSIVSASTLPLHQGRDESRTADSELLFTSSGSHSAIPIVSLELLAARDALAVCTDAAATADAAANGTAVPYPLSSTSGQHIAPHTPSTVHDESLTPEPLAASLELLCATASSLRSDPNTANNAVAAATAVLAAEVLRYIGTAARHQLHHPGVSAAFSATTAASAVLYRRSDPNPIAPHIPVTPPSVALAVVLARGHCAIYDICAAYHANARATTVGFDLPLPSLALEVAATAACDAAEACARLHEGCNAPGAHGSRSHPQTTSDNRGFDDRPGHTAPTPSTTDPSERVPQSVLAAIFAVSDRVHAWASAPPRVIASPFAAPTPSAAAALPPPAVGTAIRLIGTYVNMTRALTRTLSITSPPTGRSHSTQRPPPLTPHRTLSLAAPTACDAIEHIPAVVQTFIAVSATISMLGTCVDARAACPAVMAANAPNGSAGSAAPLSVDDATAAPVVAATAAAATIAALPSVLRAVCAGALAHSLGSSHGPPVHPDVLRDGSLFDALAVSMATSATAPLPASASRRRAAPGGYATMSSLSCLETAEDPTVASAASRHRSAAAAAADICMSVGVLAAAAASDATAVAGGSATARMHGGAVGTSTSLGTFVVGASTRWRAGDCDGDGTVAASEYVNATDGGAAQLASGVGYDADGAAAVTSVRNEADAIIARAMGGAPPGHSGHSGYDGPPAIPSTAAATAAIGAAIRAFALLPSEAHVDPCGDTATVESTPSADQQSPAADGATGSITVVFGPGRVGAKGETRDADAQSMSSLQVPPPLSARPPPPAMVVARAVAAAAAAVGAVAAACGPLQSSPADLRSSAGGYWGEPSWWLRVDTLEVASGVCAPNATASAVPVASTGGVHAGATFPSAGAAMTVLRSAAAAAAAADAACAISLATAVSTELPATTTARHNVVHWGPAADACAHAYVSATKLQMTAASATASFGPSLGTALSKLPPPVLLATVSALIRGLVDCHTPIRPHPHREPGVVGGPAAVDVDVDATVSAAMCAVASLVARLSDDIARQRTLDAGAMHDSVRDLATAEARAVRLVSGRQRQAMSEVRSSMAKVMVGARDDEQYRSPRVAPGMGTSDRSSPRNTHRGTASAPSDNERRSLGRSSRTSGRSVRNAEPRSLRSNGPPVAAAADASVVSESTVETTGNSPSVPKEDSLTAHHRVASAVGVVAGRASWTPASPSDTRTGDTSGARRTESMTDAATADMPQARRGPLTRGERRQLGYARPPISSAVITDSDIDRTRVWVSGRDCIRAVGGLLSLPPPPAGAADASSSYTQALPHCAAGGTLTRRTEDRGRDAAVDVGAQPAGDFPPPTAPAAVDLLTAAPPAPAPIASAHSPAHPLVSSASPTHAPGCLPPPPTPLATFIMWRAGALAVLLHAATSRHAAVRAAAAVALSSAAAAIPTSHFAPFPPPHPLAHAQPRARDGLPPLGIALTATETRLPDVRASARGVDGDAVPGPRPADQPAHGAAWSPAVDAPAIDAPTIVPSHAPHGDHGRTVEAGANATALAPPTRPPPARDGATGVAGAAATLPAPAAPALPNHLRRAFGAIIPPRHPPTKLSPSQSPSFTPVPSPSRSPPLDRTELAPAAQTAREAPAAAHVEAADCAIVDTFASTQPSPSHILSPSAVMATRDSTRPAVVAPRGLRLPSVVAAATLYLADVATALDAVAASAPSLPSVSLTGPAAQRAMRAAQRAAYAYSTTRAAPLVASVAASVGRLDDTLRLGVPITQSPLSVFNTTPAALVCATSPGAEQAVGVAYGDSMLGSLSAVTLALARWAAGGPSARGPVRLAPAEESPEAPSARQSTRPPSVEGVPSLQLSDHAPPAAGAQDAPLLVPTAALRTAASAVAGAAPIPSVAAATAGVAAAAALMRCLVAMAEVGVGASVGGREAWHHVGTGAARDGTAGAAVADDNPADTDARTSAATLVEAPDSPAAAAVDGDPVAAATSTAVPVTVAAPVGADGTPARPHAIRPKTLPQSPITAAASTTAALVDFAAAHMVVLSAVVVHAAASLGALRDGAGETPARSSPMPPAATAALLATLPALASVCVGTRTLLHSGIDRPFTTLPVATGDTTAAATPLGGPACADEMAALLQSHVADPAAAVRAVLAALTVHNAPSSPRAPGDASEGGDAFSDTCASHEGTTPGEAGSAADSVPPSDTIPLSLSIALSLSVDTQLPAVRRGRGASRMPTTPPLPAATSPRLFHPLGSHSSMRASPTATVVVAAANASAGATAGASSNPPATTYSYVHEIGGPPQPLDASTHHGLAAPHRHGDATAIIAAATAALPPVGAAMTTLRAIGAVPATAPFEPSYTWPPGPAPAAHSVVVPSQVAWSDTGAPRHTPLAAREGSSVASRRVAAAVAAATAAAPTAAPCAPAGTLAALAAALRPMVSAAGGVVIVTADCTGVGGEAWDEDVCRPPSNPHLPLARAPASLTFALDRLDAWDDYGVYRSAKEMGVAAASPPAATATTGGPSCSPPSQGVAMSPLAESFDPLYTSVAFPPHTIVTRPNARDVYDDGDGRAHRFDVSDPRMDVFDRGSNHQDLDTLRLPLLVPRTHSIQPPTSRDDGYTVSEWRTVVADAAAAGAHVVAIFPTTRTAIAVVAIPASDMDATARGSGVWGGVDVIPGLGPQPASSSEDEPPHDQPQQQQVGDRGNGLYQRLSHQDLGPRALYAGEEARRLQVAHAAARSAFSAAVPTVSAAADALADAANVGRAARALMISCSDDDVGAVGNNGHGTETAPGAIPSAVAAVPLIHALHDGDPLPATQVLPTLSPDPAAALGRMSAGAHRKASMWALCAGPLAHGPGAAAVAAAHTRGHGTPPPCIPRHPLTAPHSPTVRSKLAALYGLELALAKRRLASPSLVPSLHALRAARASAAAAKGRVMATRTPYTTGAVKEVGTIHSLSLSVATLDVVSDPPTPLGTPTVSTASPPPPPSSSTRTQPPASSGSAGDALRDSGAGAPAHPVVPPPPAAAAARGTSQPPPPAASAGSSERHHASRDDQAPPTRAGDVSSLATARGEHSYDPPAAPPPHAPPMTAKPTTPSPGSAPGSLTVTALSPPAAVPRAADHLVALHVVAISAPLPRRVAAAAVVLRGGTSEGAGGSAAYQGDTLLRGVHAQGELSDPFARTGPPLSLADALSAVAVAAAEASAAETAVERASDAVRRLVPDGAAVPTIPSTIDDAASDEKMDPPLDPVATDVELRVALEQYKDSLMLSSAALFAHRRALSELRYATSVAHSSVGVSSLMSFIGAAVRDAVVVGESLNSYAASQVGTRTANSATLYAPNVGGQGPTFDWQAMYDVTETHIRRLIIGDAS